MTVKEKSRQFRGYVIQSFIRSHEELPTSGDTTPESPLDSGSSTFYLGVITREGFNHPPIRDQRGVNWEITDI